MRLILARHGETAGNRDRLALGRLDISLNETGHLQAEALARRLQLAPLVAVYASPLRRACETARAVAEMHNLPVEVEEGLSEMDVGEVDGLSMEKVRELYPGFLQRWLGPEVATLPMPGGESLQEVQDRAWEAVQRIAGRHPEDTVCAVSHNFTIHVILCRALGLPITEFRRLRHDLAAVSVLDISGDRAVLVRLNDTCHLEEQGLAERRPY